MMRCILDKKEESPDSIDEMACCNRYTELINEVREGGLISTEIDKNRTLVRTDGGRIWVAAQAYKPTGVALGHPLPDPATEKLLWEVSCEAEQWLSSRLHKGDSFAFVPCESYHVTLNNYKHFDFQEKTAIVDMPEHFIPEINEVIRNVENPVSIKFSGLIITQGGKLIVPGYPLDGKFFYLRRELVAKIQLLDVNLPKIAHIKLGHILTYLDHETVMSFQAWLTDCRTITDRVVMFDSIHTPSCDIPLKKTIF
jgi:hypothetical protein